MKNEESSMNIVLPLPHAHSFKKITLKALQKCKAVEEESGIKLNTRPIWQGLNSGTGAMLDWFARTPQRFEL